MYVSFALNSPVLCAFHWQVLGSATLLCVLRLHIYFVMLSVTCVQYRLVPSDRLHHHLEVLTTGELSRSLKVDTTQ